MYESRIQVTTAVDCNPKAASHLLDIYKNIIKYIMRTNSSLEQNLTTNLRVKNTLQTILQLENNIYLIDYIGHYWPYLGSTQNYFKTTKTQINLFEGSLACVTKNPLRLPNETKGHPALAATHAKKNTLIGMIQKR